MSAYTRLAIAIAITMVVALIAVFDGDAGTTETGRYAPALEVRNAQRYADWCGGYVQVIPVRGGRDVSVQGCDR